MFTGIIEEVGTLLSAARSGQTMVLTIRAEKVLEDVNIGDSIAVNGVCLTVIRYDSSSFAADVMPETYRKTNLHELAVGSPVNLERAMAANGRFGGHFVQGHVDGIAEIVRRKQEENAVVFTIRPHDSELLQTIIPRGSITIDGISLTVVGTHQDSFTVSIIPHTLQQTVLQMKHEGATVNVETDILGKYMQHLLRGQHIRQEGSSGGLTLAALVENGFV